ncbi:MAG: phosphotransferase [Armatimonadetes bacterium]|nr:phosphotransferase [Armatimonadota bacterium]
MTGDTQPLTGRPHYDAPSITSPTALAPGERQILERLCQGSKSVSLEPLRGGYSGSRLFLLDRKDREGHVLAKGVAKIDSPEKITRERRGHLLAKDILGPNVPEVIAFAYEEDLAGVLLSLAGIRRPPLRTLQSVMTSLDGSPETLAELEEIWDEVLGVLASLYFPGREERLNLYSHNTFQEKYSQRTIDRFSTLLSWPASRESLLFQEWGLTLKHPRLFYEGVLPPALKRPPWYVACGVAHGDLNGANILLDKVKNVWLIDFFHTHENHHLLQDLTKLENDLKFLMTPLPSDEDLKALVRMEGLVQEQNSLTEPLPEVVALPSRILKTYNSIRRLREFASQVTVDPGIGNYRIPLLRYAAHTMGFEECTLLQKKAAAVSVALLCEKLSRG